MMKRTILSLLFGTASMFAMAQNQTVSHVVQRGETLESIAKYYNVSVEDIDKANPNMDGVVYVGLKLNIPTSSVQPKTSSRDVSIETSQTQELTPERAPIRNVSKEDKKYSASSEDKKYGEFIFAGELGYGFIKGSGNFMFEGTIGANYTLPYNLYVGARIGYNSANYNGLIEIEGESINAKQNCHFLQIPIEFGYSLKNESESLGLIPFVGFNTNIGLSGKYKQKTLGTGGEESSKKLKIGGKVGIGARVGIRVHLMGFDITGSYQIPLNDKQKGWFGKDAFPEISLAWGF